MDSGSRADGSGPQVAADRFGRRMKAGLAGDRVVLFAPKRLVQGAGASVLREIVDRLIAQGYSDVVIDLSECEKIDSAGTGELVALFSFFSRKAGTSLVLTRLSERAYNVLERAQLIPLFQIDQLDFSDLPTVEIDLESVALLERLRAGG